MPAAPPACCHVPRRPLSLVLPPDDTKAPFSGLVLPIPLSERDHPEDRETRLRYAVVSALGRANLIPREREHLRRARVVLQDVASVVSHK